jgi:hypothetical protein
MEFNRMIQTSYSSSRNANNLGKRCPRLVILAFRGTPDIAEIARSNQWLKNETNLIDFAMSSSSRVVCVIRLSQSTIHLTPFHITLRPGVRLPVSCKIFIALLDAFSLNAFFFFNFSYEFSSYDLHASNYSIRICFLSSEYSAG